MLTCADVCLRMLQGLRVLLLIAGSDPIVPLSLQLKLRDTLTRLGLNVSSRVFPGVTHTLNVQEEASAIRDFMRDLIREHNPALEQEALERRAAAEEDKHHAAMRRFEEVLTSFTGTNVLAYWYTSTNTDT